MILEIDQNPGYLDISYISKQGNKELCQVTVPNGYMNWQIDHSGVGTPGFIDISGRPVVRVPAKSFRRFDLLQFLKQLPDEIKAELFAYREANLTCSDIETNIGDRFPRPELAEQPINTISCVDQNFNMLVYTTFDCNKQIEWFSKVDCPKDTEGAVEDHKIWTEIATELIKDGDKLIGFRTEHCQRLFEDYGYKLINPEDKENKMEQWWFEGIKDYDRTAITNALFEQGEDGSYNLKDFHEWPRICYLKKVRYRIRKSMGFRSYHDEILAIIKEHIGFLFLKEELEKLDIKILQYPTEKEMLVGYLGNVVKFAPLLTFWNGDGFDKPYIINRCKILNVPLTIGSITGEIDSMTGTPKHTIFTDYMNLVDKFGHIKDRESLRLDYIAYRILGIGKLPYRGTLKEMQENDVCGFIAYNVIDSALIQLIHKRLNLMSITYGFSDICKLPMSKAQSQVAQTEALISLDTLDWFDADDVKLPERPKVYDSIGMELTYVAAYNDRKIPRRPYGGGHVKKVWKKLAKYCGCIDYSGLYPSLHRSYNLSVENYVSSLNDITKHYDHIKSLLPIDFQRKYASGEYGESELQREILNNPHFMTVLRQPVFSSMDSFVFQYSENIQSYLMSSTQPQGWLHVALFNDFRGNYQWYIYVWDSRVVVESGCIPMSNIDIPDLTMRDVQPIDDGRPLVLETTPEHHKYLDKMMRLRNKLIPTSGGCNVYKNDRAYAYKRIQIFLRAKRDVFKKKKQKHASIQQPFIEYALWERGLFHEKPRLPKNHDETPITECRWKVNIGENWFEPDLCHLNEKVEEDYVDQFGDLYRKGDYKDHTDFLWFLFHENIRQMMYNLNMEMSYKMVANSLYGATSNEFNCFNNIEVADDTTAEGRNAIICAEMLINNYFNYEWPTDAKAHEFIKSVFPDNCPKLVIGNMPQLSVEDRIIYIDTDSLYVWYEHVIESIGFTGDPIDFFVKFYSDYLGPIVEERLHYMTNTRHGDSMMKFDLEYIVYLGIWTQMKKYLFATAWEDGRFYDDPVQHLKIKGMDLIQGFLSEKCRTLIKHIVEDILYGKITSKADYVRSMMVAWTEFQTYDLNDISKRVNIKKDQYEKYIIGDTGDKLGFRPRCNPQYRGAAYHNWWVDKLGLNDKIERIEDGNICFYFDIYGTEFAFRINNIPDFAPEPNKVIMFYKLIVSAVNRISDVFGFTADLNLGEVPDLTDDNEE